MNPPLLTLSLLNKFLELIVTYHDFKQIDDEGILELIKFIDCEEKCWHVEDNLLYKRKAWLESLDRKERKRKENEEIGRIKDIRLRTIRSLQAKLADEFGLEKDNEQIIILAVNTLKKGKLKLADYLGIDIRDIPDMPVNYVIIDGKMEIVL